MAHAAFKGRREDARLVTGQGRYTADIDLAEQLYAQFVRSDRAHARIGSINTSAAKAHPGVIGVYTAADTRDAGFKFPGTLIHAPGRGGSKVIVPPKHYPARDRVRHVGEEVAIVIATTMTAAQDAAELVMVDYEELAVVAHPTDALKPGAVLVHDEIPDNVAYDFEYGDEAATEAAFGAAAHVVRVELESQRVAPVPMEPRSCSVSFDKATGCWDLYTPHQGPTMLKPGLCHVLGVTPDKIRLHAQDIGGGFGARTSPYTEQILLLWAARELGRSIKWVGSRSESFTTESHGRAITISGELALDRDGTFRAMRMRWLCDEGAYLTPAGAFTNTQNGPATVGGAYRFPVVYGRHRCVLTNTCPTAPYRGAGRPDMAYAVERLVDEAARTIGMDRIELRRKNAIPANAFPYTNPAKVVYDSGNYRALLDSAIEKSGWGAFESRRAEAKSRGRLRGIGLALFLEPSGGGGVPKDQVALRIDGQGTIRLHAVTQNHGQGHETVFPELVAATLGIPAERVLLDTDSPVSATLMGNGVVGSRTTMQFGSAFKLGAFEVIKRGTQLAARKLEAAAEDIEFDAGIYKVKGTDRRVGLLDLIAEHRGGDGHPLDADAEVGMGARVSEWRARGGGGDRPGHR